MLSGMTNIHVLQGFGLHALTTEIHVQCYNYSPTLCPFSLIDEDRENKLYLDMSTCVSFCTFLFESCN